MSTIFCEWEDQKVYLNKIYNTSCDEYHNFEIGDISDNDFKYCPYCGKLVIEVF